ncbi:MFS transporter [Nocardioides sp. CFH 31398]|uniref:MFS transporter n=1 Tax=Nocardioides sp. CFH 31398 TaxID=2919579 RepID=UPI001F055FF8|nr:MFS transporter [Nocardioides sp. CFH 31398]MCH1867244.1 MFS transporter [Nocardioides sp. CFH 31398]
MPATRPGVRAAAPWLVLAGIVAAAVNLRPAAVSVGPVLAEVREDLGLSGLVAGLLTSLPVIAFAAFGVASPAVARRVGAHRLTLVSLLMLVAGLTGRALVDSAVPFLVLSLLALAGMASGNVLMPALVKHHFPDRVGAVTAAYTTALAVFLTASLTLTVPIADLGGSWRWGLGAWAVVALLSAVPWFFLLGEDRRGGATDEAAADEVPVSLWRVLRTPLGLAMVVMFGFQALQAYALFGWFPLLWREAGYSPTAAGALVGLLAAVSIPTSIWLPRAAARRESQVRLCLAVWACYPIGFAMVLLAPYTLAVPAALTLGLGAALFPLVLVLIGLRSRTAAGTSGLSAVSQSGGYILSAAGPLTVGALHDTTGGWLLPVLFLLACSLPLGASVLVAGRPGHIEDVLAARDARDGSSETPAENPATS